LSAWAALSRYISWANAMVAWPGARGGGGQGGAGLVSALITKI
jgi:hypothetical protein